MDKLFTRLLTCVQISTGICFTALLILNILRILLRNFIGITWFWIPGFSRMVFIWTVFLGTTALYATDDHLIMDFFVNKMLPETKRKLSIIIHFVFLIFVCLLIIYGFYVFQVRMRIPYTSWNFPTGYAYLAVPVCGTLLLLFCLNKLRGLIFRTRELADKHV
jgi:TRAP-type C4-dicarboxylate transport system permease small subunit